MEKSDRLWTTLFLVFEIILVYPYLTNETHIAKFIKSKIPYISRLSDDLVEILLLSIVMVTVAGVAGAGAVVIGVVGGGVAIEANPVNIIFLLFFLILPVINAIFDYLSMYASRYFAKRILKDSKGLIVFDILADLVIAAFLLYCLAQTLYFVLDMTNIYFIKNEALFIPISEYKALLLSNPWNAEVLWITLMFVSTLIPTLLHIILALASFVADFIIKPHLHDLYEQLEKLMTVEIESKREKANIANSLASWELASEYKYYFLATTLLIILLVLSVAILFIKLGLFLVST